MIPGQESMFNNREIIMKKNGLLLIALFLSILPIRSAWSSDEVILQYFGTPWSEIAERLPELAEAGYTALWLPPPFKAGSGVWSVGFDTYDRFDLGSKSQMGTIPTMYGTENELRHLVDLAHRFGFRVYFDNIMAHNGGPMSEGIPGTLQPNGFVPEDFHLIRTSETTYKNPDWPSWSDEWQVLNRNPFGQDIAHETPNDSFGWAEGDNRDKYSGVRHAGHPEYYPDTDLPLSFNGSTYYTFANKEPFSDTGYTNASSVYVTNALWNGVFDWQDLDGDGQHDAGEPCESFADTGLDPDNTNRLTAAWGYGDGIYNMGNPMAEDVNGMLFRAVRWFVDLCKPDGFRLDAVKHVPPYFFGKMDDPKDSSNWGYGGQIQDQFNISRGFSDWDNHRDTVFNNVQARDDAMLFGEHLGDPPWSGSYIQAGIRVANDDFLNAVKGNIGASLQGMDNSYYAIASPGQSMLYVMSHDNNYLFSGDREQSHALLLSREGLPIVYTDGYNESGGPSWFPKPSDVPFLGQFSSAWMPNLLRIRQLFGTGYQSSRWSTYDYLSYTRYDEDVGNNDRGVTMIFILTKNYTDSWKLPVGAAVFPEGARLFNYSVYDPGMQIQVLSGALCHMDGTAAYLPPNRYYAFSWRIPEMPLLWGDHPTNSVRPIMILQDGLPVETIPVTRTDGRDGDPAFNPYALPDSDSTDYSYSIRLPRVTSSSNLTFLAVSDGSAANILMKLDGGIDLNSQMGVVTQAVGTRDNPPALSKDKFLGYEQMERSSRVVEKFAAQDVGRNVIGSLGAETFSCVIGTEGITVGEGDGVNANNDTVTWIYHGPTDGGQEGVTNTLLYPLPQNAANQPVDIWVKLGYAGIASDVVIYYTTDGTYPEGSAGRPQGTTRVAAMSWVQNAADDGTGLPDFWKGTLPAMSSGTQLRYKIAAFRRDANSVFPWSDADIAVIPRMETVFQITNFNAAAVSYYPHNDWGDVAVGLSEGFHVLRTKSILGRGEGDTPIFNEKIQTFYYDAAAPAGRFLFPAQEYMALEDSSYGIVVRSDMTVQDAWIRITDNEESNDDAETGLANGNGSWVRLSASRLAAPDVGGAPEREWAFEYVAIPTSGTAVIQVRLHEITSSTNGALSDAQGHFTTLERSVAAGANGAYLFITDPTENGTTLGAGSNMTARFTQSLAGSLNDAALAACFNLQIDSMAAVPLARTIQRNVSATEHAVVLSLPNFYNGDPAFLHTIQLAFTNASGASLRAYRKVYSTVNSDSNSDGIPDAWEAGWSLAPGSLSPAADYDGDGINDYDEYVANTNPTDDDSHFRIFTDADSSNGFFRLTFPAGVNRQFTVWQTDSITTQPVTWSNAPAGTFNGTGQYMQYTGTVSQAKSLYYRVRAELP